MSCVAGFIPLLLLALAFAVPAEARELSQQEKNQVMTAVRQHIKDPTAKFKWLPVSNDAVYCGLLNTAKTSGYMPFQAFGVTGKSAKLNIVYATDRTTKESLRQSCERYGYNFSQAAE